MVKPDWPQMKKWHMGLTSWITKVTNIHSGYVIFVVFFYVTNFARTHLHIMLHVYCLSLILNFVLGFTRHVQIRLTSHIKTGFLVHVDIKLV